MRSLAALGVLALACVSATRAGAQEAALRPVLEERGGVLDPLVGPIVPLPWAVQGTQADDIAFDPATGVYLAVGTEPVRGQLLDGTGAPSMAIDIPVSQGFAFGARVANIASRSAFVVTWSYHDKSSGWYRIGLAVVSAATGQITSSIAAVDAPWINRTLLGPGANNREMSGDASATGDTALLVLGGPPAVKAALVRVDADLQVSVGPFVDVAAGAQGITEIAVARQGGASGRRLVVYTHQPAGASDHDISATVLDRDLQVLAHVPIAASAHEEEAPAVDGDGDRWLVGYEDRTDGTVDGSPVFWSSTSATAWVGAGRVISAQAGAASPVVVATPDSYLVTTRRTGAPGTTLTSLDAFACLPCQGTAGLPSAGQTAVAGAADASGANEHAVVLFAPGKSQLLTVTDGSTTSLGGGCGAGGRARAHCAILANAGFELGVIDARASVPAFLAVSAGRAELPCGGCILIPDLGTGLVIGAGSTDALGNAALALPLPNDPSLSGAVLYEQWLLLNGSSCAGALELSSALRVQIQ
jgi:hypothetical protein